MKSFFSDRTAIITGAASGIGLALSRELCARGAMVVMADRDAAGLAAAITSMGDAGLHASSNVVDVTDAAAVRSLIDGAVARYGRLDYLFNNAGIGVVGDARDLSLEDWRTVVDTNLFGAVHGVAAAYPVMAKQGFGHIVNTASLAGLVPSPGEISYTASKYAVVGLSESLRVEARDLGVKVSVVCPGLIDTPFLRNIKLIGIGRQQLLQILPGLMAPERCARKILRGVERNKPIILVTSMAWWFWRINRISPGLMRWIWLRFTRKVRKLRQNVWSVHGASALGVVWVPCIGPFLSSMLDMVGTSGRLMQGVVLLGFYDLGLAIPMLKVAYSSHVIQRKLRAVAQHEAAFRYVTGGVLVVFGLYSLIYGNIAF